MFKFQNNTKITLKKNKKNATLPCIRKKKEKFQKLSSFHKFPKKIRATKNAVLLSGSSPVLSAVAVPLFYLHLLSSAVPHKRNCYEKKLL
jgi:hypothetical protein